MIGQILKSDNVNYITELNYNKINNKIFRISLNKNDKYYMKIQFDISEIAQDVTIYLSNTTNYIDGIKIESFYLPEKKPISKEIIFSSNADYNYICFVYNDEETSILNSFIQKINNILPQSQIKRFGIWGNPSQLLCVNGEKIQIGKTGLYEMSNENIIINFLGIIPQKSNFIIDYEY